MKLLKYIRMLKRKWILGECRHLCSICPYWDTDCKIDFGLDESYQNGYMKGYDAGYTKGINSRK